MSFRGIFTLIEARFLTSSKISNDIGRVIVHKYVAVNDERPNIKGEN